MKEAETLEALVTTDGSDAAVKGLFDDGRGTHPQGERIPRWPAASCTTRRTTPKAQNHGADCAVRNPARSTHGRAARAARRHQRPADVLVVCVRLRRRADSPGSACGVIGKTSPAPSTTGDHVHHVNSGAAEMARRADRSPRASEQAAAIEDITTSTRTRVAWRPRTVAAPRQPPNSGKGSGEFAAPTPSLPRWWRRGGDRCHERRISKINKRSTRCLPDEHPRAERGRRGGTRR